MANAKIEEASNEEMAADSAMAAYGEDDDVATQHVEPPHSEPRWLVQITPFDRRTMDTTALMSEVLAGRLTPSTPVWRTGMRDWTPIERLLELPIRPSGVRAAGGAGPAPVSRGNDDAPLGAASAHVGADWNATDAAFARAARSPALAGPAFWLVNAAVALAMAAATLGVLTAGGVFD